MQRLPFDIYLEIVNHFGPAPEYRTDLMDIDPHASIYAERRRSLHNMALVCRDFYHHFFPLLFENIMISQRRFFASHEENASPPHFARFCTSIVAGDHLARALAKQVKRYVVALFDLNVWYSYQTRQALAVYSKALAFMSNLRELYLLGSAVTNDLIRSIVVLPRLTVLQLENNCPVPDCLDEPALAQFSSNLRITHVRIHDRHVGVGWNNRSHAQQFFRHFCMQYTQVLTNLWPHAIHSHFFEGIATLRPMTRLHTVNLNHLEIDSSHPHALSAALGNMPALKSLHIKKVSYNAKGEAVLDPWAKFPKMPHLEHIHLPLPALKVLVPGSLATSVGVSVENLAERPVEYGRGREFWKGHITPLKQSRRPLESMDIPMNLYTSVCLTDHFPDLIHLKVWPKHDNWYAKEDPDDILLNSDPDKTLYAFLYAWPEFPKVTELEFVYDRSGIPNEGELKQNPLTTVKPKIPSLRRLAFTKHRRGSRREYFLDPCKEPSGQA